MIKTKLTREILRNSGFTDKMTTEATEKCGFRYWYKQDQYGCLQDEPLITEHLGSQWFTFRWFQYSFPFRYVNELMQLLNMLPRDLKIKIAYGSVIESEEEDEEEEWEQC